MRQVLAGALQDNGRARVAGTPTFGKGLIQTIVELSDGSGVAVTVARYQTPAGTDINKARSVGPLENTAAGLGIRQYDEGTGAGACKLQSSTSVRQTRLSPLTRSVPRGRWASSRTWRWRPRRCRPQTARASAATSRPQMRPPCLGRRALRLPWWRAQRRTRRRRRPRQAEDALSGLGLGYA